MTPGLENVICNPESPWEQWPDYQTKMYIRYTCMVKPAYTCTANVHTQYTHIQYNLSYKQSQNYIIITVTTPEGHKND